VPLSALTLVPVATNKTVTTSANTATGAGENALQFELENLIAAIYPTTAQAPTIATILGDGGQDDAVVPLTSQIAGGPAQSVQFAGLAHIPVSDERALNALHKL
jgi:hypothetical protein